MVVDLLRSAEAQGVRVYQRSGKLHFVAKRGAMSDELLNRLKTNRADIIEHLAADEMVNAPMVSPTPEDASPLSCAQHRIWLLDKIEGGSPAYNMPAAFRVSGPLSSSALKKSVGDLVERHSALRTYFVEHDGLVEQRVRLTPPIPFDEQDLTHVRAPEATSVLARRAEEEALRPFELTLDLPIRVTLGRLSELDHVLFVTLHHVACDGWSIETLVDELGRLYQSHTQGQSLELPAQKLRYSDYARWQQAWLTSTQAQRQLDYWVRALEGLPALHRLPLDVGRADRGKGLGVIHDRCLSVPLQRAIEQRSRQSGTTLFMFLQASFAVLLGRYSNETDIAVGTPVAGRMHRDTEDVVGNFVNTVVLRTSLADNPEFSEVLERTKRSTLEGLNNQQLPFDKVVEHVCRQRPRNANPIFQVMFALHEFDDRELEIANATVTRLEQAPTEAKLDLELHVFTRAGQLVCRWVYDAALFEPRTIRSLAECYCTLLGQFAHNPQMRIQSAPLGGIARRAELLAQSTGEAVPVPFEPTHHLFAQQVAATPEAVAVQWEATRVSYGALERRANTLAHRLRARGVGRGTFVGVYMRRSLDLLPGLLAIWKAGGAYVPLDPEQPSARVQEILQDANLKVVLTQKEVAHSLLGLDVELLDVDDVELEEAPQSNPCHVDGEDPAYVLYTSGSTGRPKGAVIRHRGLVNYLCHAATRYMTPEVEGSVVSSPLTFDATLTSLLTPLITGAQVNLLPNGDNATVLSCLAERLFESKGSWLFKLTPAHLDVLAGMASGVKSDARHVIVVGGEQLTADTLVAWRTEILPESTFINEYGPTETVVGCSIYALPPRQAFSTSSTGAVPIGQPIQNTQLYVVNPTLSSLGDHALQPTGAMGELYIGGAGVARDYLNRDRLNAERFVADPFSTRPGARLYRTGDLVRRRFDGELEFLGRTDDQIKLRGYRIEPGEIEEHLRKVPGVRDAVVLARRDAAGEVSLTAYVTGNQALALTDTEVCTACREFLARRLPGYMVPAAFVYLQELPLTTNGKVDRSALPEPGPAPSSSATYIEPCTPQERQLCQLWSEILGVERVSTDADFFQLGGHSLSATRLVAQIHAALGVEISLRDVFDHPNVRALSERLVAATRPSVEGSAPYLEKTGALSFAQRRLRFIDQFEGDSTQYNMFAAFRLSGRLDTRALSRAVDALIMRHESLRTVFPRLDGGAEAQFAQTVQSQWDTPIAEHDLTGLVPTARDEAIARLIGEETNRPFDLAHDVLLRVVLLRCAESRWVLLVNLHHIAADGWSVVALRQEFSHVYSSYVNASQPELPPIPLRYLEFAHRQQQARRERGFEGDLAYWRRQLSDLPTVHGVPLRGPRHLVQRHAGASHTHRFPAELTSALKDLCRQREVTTFMAIHTAFTVLLSRYSNKTDVVVGTAISGRDYAGSDRTVGLFVNLLVLRTDLSGNPTFDTLLAANKATILDAYQHQNVPFDVLVEELRPERSLSYDPIVQVALTLQNDAVPPLELAELTVEPLPVDETHAKFDLHLDVAVAGDQLELTWLFKTDLFEPPFIERMAHNFETLLRSIVADPERTILYLPLLHHNELETLLAPLAAVREHAPPAGCLHEYFEASARRHPTRTAVRDGGRSFTYEELDRQSNRLCRYLIERGVGLEARVGLCMTPSFETLVGILGILKAGGAYVPVSPEQPDRRLQYVLRDAAVELVITQSALRARVDSDNRAVVCIDDEEYLRESADLSPNTPVRAGAPVHSHHAAYVIYTSGSTGEPKGVCVEHRNVLSLMGSTGEHFRFTERDVWTLCHSFAFDFSVWEMWGGLFHGGCVVIVPEATTKDPERLSALLDRERVTVLSQTPRAFYALQEVMVRTARRQHLRYVVFGGEALDYGQLRPWYDTYGESAQLVNMYGITETTVHVSFAPIGAGDLDVPTSGIGHPLSSLFGLVCNDAQQPQPIGCSGELLVAGGGVARGYLNRPELTAERFVSLDAFGGERFYRTGDRVQRSEAGTLNYQGRVDSQVKIRGFRVEPGEIEMQLASLSLVKQGVVAPRHDDTRGTTLVAYVVPNPSARTSGGDADLATACRVHLQSRLPNYMIPSAFVVLNEFPLTTNGKVDYRALPSADVSAQPGGSCQAPRTELESKLAAAWQEVLQLDTVGIDDNFFEVGGHSLATITLTTLLKRKYELDIPVAEVFRNQTIRSISDALRDGTLQRDNLALLLKIDGSKPPLFFLPPATGVGHCFMALSARLPSDRPHYAFMTPGQETGDELPKSVQSLARRYLDHIRSHHGVLSQWYLAGYSVGGVVAYEVAQQCIEAGYPAPHLIMLDSYLPRRKPLIPLRPAQILYDVYGDDASRYLITAKHLVKLFFEYRPRPAPIKVTVFKAQGSSALVYNNRRDWRRFALAGVDVVPVSGGHRTLLEAPNLPTLANAFELCFAANDERQV